MKNHDFLIVETMKADYTQATNLFFNAAYVMHKDFEKHHWLRFASWEF